MRILVAVALLLSLLVTIFAVQNNAATTVSFLFWSVEGSFALVLMITLIIGIVTGILLMLPGSVRNRMRAGELKRNLRGMEAERPAPPPVQPPSSGPPGDGNGETEEIHG